MWDYYILGDDADENKFLNPCFDSVNNYILQL